MIRTPLQKLPSGAACEVQTGLANLRDCGRNAALQCPRCGKFMCAVHQVQPDDGSGMICTECYGLGDPQDTSGDAGSVAAGGAGMAGAGAFGAMDRKGLAGKKDDSTREDKTRSGFGDS